MFNLDECVVGYRDRHVDRAQEKPVGNWVSESTHEEFIPQHRIEYFKQRGKIIWDRAGKIDKVFNSGLSAGNEICWRENEGQATGAKDQRKTGDKAYDGMEFLQLHDD